VGLGRQYLEDRAEQLLFSLRGGTERVAGAGAARPGDRRGEAEMESPRQGQEVRHRAVACMIKAQRSLQSDGWGKCAGRFTPVGRLPDVALHAPYVYQQATSRSHMVSSQPSSMKRRRGPELKRPLSKSSKAYVSPYILEATLKASQRSEAILKATRRQRLAARNEWDREEARPAPKGPIEQQGEGAGWPSRGGTNR
jgi:hypothetical protein